jgi:hypothetical protein
MTRHLAPASLAVLLVSVPLALPAPARAADLDTRYGAPFSTLPMYQTNTSVLMRDWNGDGLLDVTVTCNADDRVSTLKGVGQGAFGGRVDFSGPDGPYKVAAGDINGDGTADMVLALYDANSVRVYYLLPGDVSYSTSVDLPVGSGPVDVAVTDIDQDGDNDIVTSNFNSNNISVLRNSGGGTFLPHADYAVGQNPWGMAVGRVNADAYPDVVTADFSSSTVTLWLGSSTGTLTFGYSLSAGSNPTDVALVDLDADGVGDMALANLNASNITLVDAYGNIALQVVGTIPSLSGYEVVAADFNNDGKIDLAIAGSENASGSGTVHLGSGVGAFGPRHDFATGGNLSIGMSAGDLDGDGKLDLALASSPNNVSLLRGNGDGTFGVNRALAPDGVNADFKKVVLAQMNGDSHLDLVLAGSANVRVAQGNGSGAFSFVGQSGAPAVDIAVADLDGDGDRDVASVRGTAFTNLALSYNPGNGAIATGAIYTVGGIAVSVAAGDVDHDGYPDLVVGCDVPGDLFFLRNLGDGSFAAATSVAGSGWRRAVAIADVDGDGDPDIVGRELPRGQRGGLPGGWLGRVRAEHDLCDGTPAGLDRDRELQYGRSSRSRSRMRRKHDFRPPEFRERHVSPRDRVRQAWHLERYRGRERGPGRLARSLRRRRLQLFRLDPERLARRRIHVPGTLLGRPGDAGGARRRRSERGWPHGHRGVRRRTLRNSRFRADSPVRGRHLDRR